MKNIWLAIKSFWYLGLVIFGTVGVMLGMGMGPTITPRIISLLLIVACSLLGLIAIFLHFSQNHTNKLVKKIEIMEKALKDSQEREVGVQRGFQAAVDNFTKEIRAWQKKFDELSFPTPTDEELRQAMHGFEMSPPPKQGTIWWEKLKALPLLKKS